MKINGKWKINYPEIGRVEDKILFDFISNNQRFIGISPISLIFITHFDEIGNPQGVNFIDDDYNLVSEYTTISIIGEAELDEDLIIAFEMEKISDVDTIPMTHPKGIKLLTKGKKCTEDIEVVPTFEMGGEKKYQPLTINYPSGVLMDAFVLIANGEIILEDAIIIEGGEISVEVGTTVSYALSDGYQEHLSETIVSHTGDTSGYGFYLGAFIMPDDRASLTIEPFEA